MSGNPQLLYAVKYFIHKANPKGKYFNHTSFNKLLIELYLRLKEKGLDIKLPYCWYRHGGLVDSPVFQSVTGIPLTLFAPPDKSVISIPKLPIPEDISDGEARLIQEETQGLLAEHPTRDYLEYNQQERYVNLNYQRAPLKFQVEFRRSLIPHLEYLNNRNLLHRGHNSAVSDPWSIRTIDRDEELDLMVRPVSLDLSVDDQHRVIQQLDNLVRIYPREEMRELHRAYLKWDDTFRLAIKHQENLLNQANDFWEIFAYLLRVKFNDNIHEERIREWQEIFEKELIAYREKLENTRDRLLELEARDVPYDIENDKTLKKLMTISREMALER